MGLFGKRGRRWVRKRPGAVVARQRAEAKREVRAYASGAKQMKASSPRVIREHGKILPPRMAARNAFLESDYHRGRVSDRYPNADLYRHRTRKSSAADRKTRTSTGGRWTLQKAGVGRDKRTGRFKRR